MPSTIVIIPSEQILAALSRKVHSHAQDHSRHLLCPTCRVRTKLYTLKDGRRKCSACGTKFHPDKKTDAVRLRRHADLLLCFCLDITAKQASDMTGYRYRLVSAVYDHLRLFLASQTLTPDEMRRLTIVEACDHGMHGSDFCRRCRSRFKCKGRSAGDSPVFGMKIAADGRVAIDPLEETSVTNAKGVFAGYAGFICRGKFHRFMDNEQAKDGAERLWAWMSERLKKHHGIWKGNVGLYLKELEWKYNNRLLSSETQALTMTDLLPADFLAAGLREQKIPLDAVQKSA